MKKLVYSHLSLLLLSILTISCTQAQTIQSEKGYSPQIGVVVSMLDDLYSRVMRSVIQLNTKETDFLLDDDANRIGALIMHLAATEKYYQVYTFENRDFNAEEAKIWKVAQDLGTPAREKFVGKPIKNYLGMWSKVRKETKRLLRTKDDKWFDSKVNGSNMNNHWAWYHVMEHQANHMGQIRLIIKRM